MLVTILFFFHIIDVPVLLIFFHGFFSIGSLSLRGALLLYFIIVLHCVRVSGLGFIVHPYLLRIIAVFSCQN